MSTKTTLLLVAGAAFAYWAYTKYRTVVSLQFVPRGISSGPAGFQVVLGVQNTSNQSVQYNSFAGTLTVNGTAVGNVSDFLGKPILPNAETDLTFNISPNIVGLASSIFQQVQGGFSGIQSATIQGVANIGGQQYNVNVQLA